MGADPAPQPIESEAVLVVDDEPSVCDVLARSVGLAGYPSETAGSGDEAIAAVRSRPFALVLDDIRMPGMDGVALLRHIVSESPRTAVIMVTAVLDVKVAIKSIHLGAEDYVVKPFDVDDLVQRIERTLARRRQRMDAEHQRAQLEREVAERTADARRVFLGAVQSLAAALDARDGYTHGHSQRVTALAVALAERLGLPQAAVEQIRVAGMLHDIGKIGIRESVLNKVETLTTEEYVHIQTHPAIAQSILQPILWDPETVRLIRSHHEGYDGAGYPDGLTGAEIPLGARILAVADAFDAMTSQRPYRDPMTTGRALEVLRAGRGKQWDPEVVDELHRLPHDLLGQVAAVLG
jgi:putative nucleotidyltransferase with HDIG domain